MRLGCGGSASADPASGERASSSFPDSSSDDSLSEELLEEVVLLDGSLVLVAEVSSPGESVQMRRRPGELRHLEGDPALLMLGVPERLLGSSLALMQSLSVKQRPILD